MLDSTDQQTLMAAIDALPCAIEFPEGWGDNGEGFLQPSPTYADQRQYPRFACRGTQGRAALEYQHSLPAISRVHRIWRVYLMDLSRSGIRFLHGEPLYPREWMRIVLSDGKRRGIEVQWCLRIQKDCYAIGTRFSEQPV